MTVILNKQIHLASRPSGEATTGHFRLLESAQEAFLGLLKGNNFGKH